ncbi:MAG: CBS domain-containing protein, partial [Candidatus Caldatribacteriota bacterium]|nr:CBS domain-containing protein [Candidatus Caldatribacteriota bacterium]
LNNFMNIGLDKEQKQLMNQLLHSAREILCKGVNIIIARATVDKYTEGLAFLTHKLMEIQNSDAFFTLVKMNENIYIVGRSKVNSVEVDVILNEMGGGGHFQAASAVVKNKELDEVENQLIKILDKKIVLGITAKNIMTSPVKTVDIYTSIEETRKISLRYGHNGIPVMEQEKLKGIITMQELNRAKRHGFGKEPVSKYMSKKIIHVKPDESLTKIQELMVSFDIGRILVIDLDNKLKGIVTRTDLIRSLHGEDNIPQRSFSTYIENRNKIEKNNQLKLIKENFPEEIQNMLCKIGSIGDRLKYPVFMVGGVVRDLFLGIKNYDLDIAVEGNGIKYARELCKVLKGRMKSYKKFNTAIIILPNGFKIDIATARREFYEYPAALPKVELSSMKKDLYRRDFTINAMAIQLNKKYFGKLIDFFGGKKDLQLKIIRVLYNLSFVEDPARIIRAIRFEQRYDFKMDKSTEYFLKKAIDDKLLSKLRRKRMAEELILILNEIEPERALKRMMYLGVIKNILPGVVVDNRKVEKIAEARKCYKYWKNNFIDEKVEIWLIYFTYLLKDLEISKIQRICRRMMLKTSNISKINGILLNYDLTVQFLEQKNKLSSSEVYIKLKSMTNEMLFILMMENRQKRLNKRIIKFLKLSKHEKLEITGKDIEKTGLQPGPIYSTLLNKLLYAKLDGKIKNKEEEIKFVKKILIERERNLKK